MNNICSEAERILDEQVRDELREIRNFLCLCESPVEQILVASVYVRFGMSFNSHFNLLQARFGDMPEYDGIFTLNLELQKPITTAVFGGSYRADVFLYLTRFWRYGNKQPAWGKLVVEVDGHNFHDRTKEQASRDRQRDRDLLLDGYKVIRFTGSDVYNNPFRCVEEIEFLIGNEASEVFHSYLNNGRLEELLMGAS